MTKEEKTAYMKEYRAKNRARVRLISKKSYDKNKENNKVSKNIYREKNKAKIKQQIKNWGLINKEHKQQKAKEWYIKNKDIVKARVKCYQKNRKRIDPVFKLKTNLRTMISNLLKKRGFTKTSNTFKIVGCTYAEFLVYIENHFESWMDWNNYGLYNGKPNYGWDIDHIKSMKSAKTEDEVVKLNHYTNLRPLCGLINRKIKRSS